jgi:hypothetical protein
MTEAVSVERFLFDRRPVTVIAVASRDHAVLERHVGQLPADRALLRRWDPHLGVDAQLTRDSCGDIVVVASHATTEATRIAEFCRRLDERGVRIALVRWTAGGDHERPWPDHPVDIVVDVPPGRRRELLDLIGRAFLARSASWLPLPTTGFARMTSLSGDPRASACFKQLRMLRREWLVLGLVPHPRIDVQPPVWAVLSSEEPPSSMKTYPLVDERIDVDPRRYRYVDPPDDPEEQAYVIARLHRAHGDWRSTTAAVEAFANGDLEDAIELLDWLGGALGELDPLPWAVLVARAAASSPAGTTVDGERRAFWRAVDALARDRKRPPTARHVSFAVAAQRAESDEPPRTATEQALDIGALQVAHGDWRATLAAVEACIHGDVAHGLELLDALGAVLEERRPLTWRTITARVRAMRASPTTLRLEAQPSWVTRPPGYKRDRRMYTVAGRRAFWRWVDVTARDKDAADQRETALYHRYPAVHEDLIAASREDHTKVGLPEDEFWRARRRALTISEDDGDNDTEH